jgi:hypothetical protein
MSVIIGEDVPLNRVIFVPNDKKNSANFFKSALLRLGNERFVFAISSSSVPWFSPQAKPLRKRSPALQLRLIERTEPRLQTLVLLP